MTRTHSLTFCFAICRGGQSLKYTWMVCLLFPSMNSSVSYRKYIVIRIEMCWGYLCIKHINNLFAIRHLWCVCFFLRECDFLRWSFIKNLYQAFGCSLNLNKKNSYAIMQLLWAMVFSQLYGYYGCSVKHHFFVACILLSYFVKVRHLCVWI